jgi:hypothetical protein
MKKKKYEVTEGSERGSDEFRNSSQSLCHKIILFKLPPMPLVPPQPLQLHQMLWLRLQHMHHP